MMRSAVPTRRQVEQGFTLIELLIVVVIIGILASIAIPKFANTKDKAKVTSLKSDLRNLVGLQEAHFSIFARYAENVGAARSEATVVFFQTDGNTITMRSSSPTAGWSATATRTDLAIPMTCGIYLGTEPSPNPAVTREGEVSCWQ